MNRKFIRPHPTMKNHRHTPVTTPETLPPAPDHPARPNERQSNYYLKQMANKTRMVIVLKDGEELRGAIEWIDRDAIKVHHPDAHNILLMKDNVKYMFKQDEDKGNEEKSSGEGWCPAG